MVLQQCFSQSCLVGLVSHPDFDAQLLINWLSRGWPKQLLLWETAPGLSPPKVNVSCHQKLIKLTQQDTCLVFIASSLHVCWFAVFFFTALARTLLCFFDNYRRQSAGPLIYSKCDLLTLAGGQTPVKGIYFRTWQPESCSYEWLITDL